MRSKKRKTGIIILLVFLWMASVLAAVLVTAAYTSDIRTEEGDIVTAWVYFTKKWETIRAYVSEEIMPALVAALTVVATVLCALWPAVSKVKMAAGLFHVSSEAEADMIKEAKRIEERNDEKQKKMAEQNRKFIEEQRAAMQEMREGMIQRQKDFVAEQEKKIEETRQIAEETREETRRVTRMVCVACSSTQELVMKNAAEKIREISEGGRNHEEGRGEETTDDRNGQTS